MNQKIKSPCGKTTGRNINTHKHYTIKKKRVKPPYSKDLEEKLLHGYKAHNDIFIFIGKCSWGKAEGLIDWEKVLVLPSKCSPEDYDWNIVCKQPVLIYDTEPTGSGLEIIRQLGYELLKAGATVVRVINPNYVFIAKFITGRG